MRDDQTTKVTYEPPTLTDEGSVAELTLATDTGAYLDQNLTSGQLLVNVTMS